LYGQFIGFFYDIQGDCEAIAKSRAQKITEARRVGVPRWSSEAAAGGRASNLI